MDKDKLKRLKKNIKTWKNTPLKNKLIFTILNAFIPLLIGAAVYILFIPTAHISEYIHRFSGKEFTIDKVDLSGSGITSYLADFLWAYALYSMVMFLMVEDCKDIYKSLIICVVFEATIEILQRTPLIDGTFDICDIGIELLGNICALFVILVYCTILNIHSHLGQYNNK